MYLQGKTSPPITVDETICRGCEMCVLACSLVQTGQCNPALARLSVARVANQYAFTLHVCLHCADPDCMAACPAEAMEIDKDGIVTIIDERCIICGYCRDACPHEAISYHQERAVYLKCDLCRARVNGPVCVEVCPTGALSLTSAIREDEKL